MVEGIPQKKIVRSLAGCILGCTFFHRLLPISRGIDICRAAREQDRRARSQYACLDGFEIHAEEMGTAVPPAASTAWMYCGKLRWL